MAGRETLRIADARVPRCLLDGEFPDAGEQLAAVDLEISDGRVAAIAAAADQPGPAGAACIDQDGGQVWPGLIDVHSHLDKGHIWPRAASSDGTFEGAMTAARADREGWTAEDVRARFAFGLCCAYAHGTVAIRTHIDSEPPFDQISWPVLRELRAEWAGRIEIEGAALAVLDVYGDRAGEALADRVAEAEGVLGAFVLVEPEVDDRLDRLFALATERALDLDFHVDESGQPGAVALRHVAQAALRNRFEGQILCGHCCALAVQPPAEVARTLDLVQAAGIAVVSLPMCNLYLQDREAGRTPRWRGVTLLHEMAARGIEVAVASDNCRDPFYGYGDHDLLEVFREAVRIAHLDRPVGAWPCAVTRTPAAIMGLADQGVIRVGAPADLILFRGRHWSELLSRPQADRIVLRAGVPIDTTPPDYRTLDGLVAGGRAPG